MSDDFEAAIFFYKPYPGNELADRVAADRYPFPCTLEEWADFDYVGSAGPWVSKSKYATRRALQVLPEIRLRQACSPPCPPPPDVGEMASTEGLLPFPRRAKADGAAAPRPEALLIMDILLTHGYFISEDPHEQKVMKPYPPLGVLYISAYLKSRGFSVHVHDTTFSSKEETQRYIEQARPGIVGIYTNLMTKLNVLPMIKWCKSVGAQVVLGGPEPPYYAENFLDAGADVVAIRRGRADARGVDTRSTEGRKQAFAWHRGHHLPRRRGQDRAKPSPPAVEEP